VRRGSTLKAERKQGGMGERGTVVRQVLGFGGERICTKARGPIQGRWVRIGPA